MPAGIARDQLHHLLDTLPAAAYTCSADGLITYFNRRAVELWGREPLRNDPRDRFCGSFRLWSPDGRPIPRDQCWMARALSEGREFNGREILIERPGGERIHALEHANPIWDGSGRLVGAVNVVVDITDRKKVEESLIAVKDELASQLADVQQLLEMSVVLSATLELRPILEETLRTATLVEGAGLGHIALSDPDGNGPGVEASLGFDRESLEALRRIPLGGVVSATAIEEAGRIVVEDTESDTRIAPYREAVRRAGFRAVHSTPLLARSGDVAGVLSIFFPIPHRPAEREMQLVDLCARQAMDFIENARLYGQLREADRSKNEFLATLAHELRNPLAPIRNAVQILHLKAEPDSEVTWALEVVDRQMEQVTRLVDDLLDIARITGNKLDLRREPVELAEVLRVAVETSRPLIDASGLHFELAVSPEPVFLDGDAIRLSQVISNLLNNSAKYTEQGGQIRLAVERQGADAVISVRDTGIGIPADMLPRIFELFTQVHRSPEQQHPIGLGIGLTLVKRLVEMHGGTIEARSEGLGKGSEFIVRLPIVIETKAALLHAGEEAPAPASPASLKILIVDDNLDAAASLGLLLRLIGNDIRTAHDGLEAVRVAEEFRPDVVVLDIGLPKVNGYEAAWRIRQQEWGRDMVLIAATGWGQEADRHRSRESGFDHHLVKPVDPVVLIQLLASLSPGGPRPHALAGLAD